MDMNNCTITATAQQGVVGEISVADCASRTLNQYLAVMALPYRNQVFEIGKDMESDYDVSKAILEMRNTWRAIGRALYKEDNTLSDLIQWSKTLPREVVSNPHETCAELWKDCEKLGKANISESVLTEIILPAKHADPPFPMAKYQREWKIAHGQADDAAQPPTKATDTPRYISAQDAYAYEEPEEQDDEAEPPAQIDATASNQAVDEQSPAEAATSDDTEPARDVETNSADRDDTIAALFEGGQSDRDYAKRLALFCGDSVRWVTDDKAWLVYEHNEHGGGKWRDVGIESSCLAPQLGDLADTLKAHARGQVEQKIANAFQATRKQMQAVTQFKGIKPIYITSEDLNTHPELLNCQNGVVDLSTGRLMDVAPELLLTQQCAAVYNPKCTDKLFATFLESVLPDTETREVVISYLGYTLTADVSAEKYLNIYGRGGNGKGALLLTMRKLMGDYACELSPDAVLEGGKFSNATGRATTELTPLVGRRLGIVDELPRGAHFDIAKVNRLTGRDFLPVRKLRREGEDVPPTHKLIMCGNYFTRIDDPRADSVLRRLVAVKFGVDFTQDPDTTLKDRLQAPEALSGALNVLVPAAIEFYKHGLRKPSPLMEAARDELLGASDFIGDFLAEYYEFGDGDEFSVPRKDLIGHLRNACRDECARYNDRELVAMLSKVKGVTYKKDRRDVFHFYGLQQRFIPPE